MISMIEEKEVDPQEVFDFFLEIAKNDLQAQSEIEEKSNINFFKADVIEGRIWFKGYALVSDLRAAYINPSSDWLKRFSCKCNPAVYPCSSCTKDNLITFGDFVNNQERVWHIVDKYAGLSNDYEHKKKIEEICKDIQIVFNNQLIIHETNEAWAAEYGITFGSLVVRDGNHRFAALLKSKDVSKYIPVYFGKLKSS